MTAVEQSRLTRWGHTWRLLLMLMISALSWSEMAPWQWKHDRVWFWADLAVGVGSLVLVHARRRRPLLVAVLTALAGAVSGSVGGPATLALMSLATHRRWREIVPVSLISVGATLLLQQRMPINHDSRMAEFVALVAVIGVTVGWGLYVGSRRELLATLRERAVRAESEQALRVQQARDAERTRIAREMHDVLAHRISLVAMHSGALTYRQDLTVGQMRETAEVIQTNAHLAMTELREVLGILREPDRDAALVQPQPSARDIPAVVAEARAAGLKVDLDDRLSGEPGLAGLSELTGRTAFRVVQEGLTNVRKHAQSTRVVLLLNGSPQAGVTVELRNPLQVGGRQLSVPTSGLGLVGLGERVGLAGGRLSHEVTADHLFVLRAWLPWQA